MSPPRIIDKYSAVISSGKKTRTPKKKVDTKKKDSGTGDASILFRCDFVIRDKINAACKKHGMSQARLLRSAVNMYLKKLEREDEGDIRNMVNRVLSREHDTKER